MGSLRVANDDSKEEISGTEIRITGSLLRKPVPSPVEELLVVRL